MKPKLAAWTVIFLATCLVGFIGFGIASSSVVVNRQGFLEFGIAGAVVVLSLLVAAKGAWKIIAVPVGLLCAGCYSSGWAIESIRFESGQGGEWLNGIPWALLGFVLIIAVAVWLLRFNSTQNHQSKAQKN